MEPPKVDQQKEALKFKVSDDCKLEFLKLNKILDLGDNYILVRHPFAQVEGELLIYQAAEESSDKDLLRYPDFSLKKRVKTDNTKYIYANAAQKKKREDKLQVSTKLQCLEIDTEAPLSPCDWKHISTLVDEIKAMAWVQVLPVGVKSSQPYQFNCIHVLPSQDIPFPKIPLDSMISNRMMYLRKREKRMSRGHHAGLRPLSGIEEMAIEAGLIVIPEF